MIKYETPLVFDLIEASSVKRVVFFAPDPDLVESVCLASKDGAFSKPKFKRYMAEYRKYGIYPPRAKKMTAVRLIYYKSVRFNNQERQLKIQKNLTRQKLEIIRDRLRERRIAEHKRLNN